MIEQIDRINRRRIAGIASKGIGKAPLQYVEHMVAGVTGHGRSAQMHDLTQVVEPVCMIGVLVRPDDGIDLTYAGIEQLQPHVGAGIDKDTKAAK